MLCCFYFWIVVSLHQHYRVEIELKVFVMLKVGSEDIEYKNDIILLIWYLCRILFSRRLVFLLLDFRTGFSTENIRMTFKILENFTFNFNFQIQNFLIFLFIILKQNYIKSKNYSLFFSILDSIYSKYYTNKNLKIIQ